MILKYLKDLIYHTLYVIEGCGNLILAIFRIRPILRLSEGFLFQCEVVRIEAEIAKRNKIRLEKEEKAIGTIKSEVDKYGKDIQG